MDRLPPTQTLTRAEIEPATEVCTLARESNPRSSGAGADALTALTPARARLPISIPHWYLEDVKDE